MKTTTAFLFSIILAITAACSDDDSSKANNSNNSNNDNIIINYDHTGCKNELKSITDYEFSGFECIYYNTDGSGNLEMSHINAVFNCCPDETLGLTGDIQVSGGDISVTESDNGGNCFCECPYDLNYSVTGLETSSYTVNFNTFDTAVEIDISTSSEGVVCIDKVPDMTSCINAGERGCSCEDSSECMGGDGYCLDGLDVSPFCVNTCENTTDCPMPDLEECMEDNDGTKFCAPLSLVNSAK